MSGFAFRPSQSVLYEGSVFRFSHHAKDAQQTHVFMRDDGPALNLAHEDVREALQTGAMKQDVECNSGRPRAAGLIQMDRDPRLARETERKLRWVLAWLEVPGRPRSISALDGFIRERTSLPPGSPSPGAPSPSGSSLYRWIGQYEMRGKTMDALIPQTANRGCRLTKLDPGQVTLLEEMIGERYLTEERITVAQLHREVEKRIKKENREGHRRIPMRVPSRQAITRRISKICPYERDCMRLGRKAADAQWRQNGNGSFTDRINQQWEIDHTICDIELVSNDGGHVIGRPTLTVVVDNHSRMIMSLPEPKFVWIAGTMMLPMNLPARTILRSAAQ